jgi:hypothetical protein
MSKNGDDARPRGPLALSALVGRVLDPLSAKRGFANAELIAAWPEIAGPRYAETTQPESIAWPRGPGAQDGGTLTLRVEPAVALYLQHETGQLTERVNRFLGFAAVRRIRMVQKPLDRTRRRKPPELPTLSTAEEAALDQTVAGIDHEGLRDALKQLGRGVLKAGQA